ncbi:MAG: RluA family pseudouridine synthase [Firmicutes bacterium]|nr:RluA family pseudouridine synthase [Bacillota bacterium]
MSAHPPFLEFFVEPNDDGRALARILRQRWHLSRTLLRRLKRDGAVHLNGRPVPLREPVRSGDRVAVFLPEGLASRVRAEPVPLSVVYEDAHVLVLDKPAGLLTHPARAEVSGTLANGVAQYLVSRGDPPFVAPVNRLDRNTSGLVVFARHPHAHHMLSTQLARGLLRRTYLAVVEGVVKNDNGVVDAPIRRVPGETSRREVGPGGQPAVTRYRVLARTRPGRRGSEPLEPDSRETGLAATILEVNLETGRTHQIRVHLAHLGHPLLGDGLYGKTIPGVAERQALHAARVEFPHPADGRRMRFESPLPADLAELLVFLGLPSPVN